MTVEEMRAGAVQMPHPEYEQRREIAELMRVVRSYTYPVVFNTHLPVSEKGTAVLLRHGERMFAFTAAHTIEADTSIYVGDGPISEGTEFGVLDTYIHPKYDRNARTSKYDLAILELEPNPRIASGSVEQLYSGEIRRLEGDPAPGETAQAFFWVCGYPVGLHRHIGNRTVLFQTAFCTQILEYSPEQLSLDFPRTGYQMPHGGTTWEVGDMTQTPHGYSGGGVWATTNPKDEWFKPQKHVKLVGIQTHWSAAQRLIRCVSSKVIVEALKDFKPDL